MPTACCLKASSLGKLEAPIRFPSSPATHRLDSQSLRKSKNAVLLSSASRTGCGCQSSLVTVRAECLHQPVGKVSLLHRTFLWKANARPCAERRRRKHEVKCQATTQASTEQLTEQELLKLKEKGAEVAGDIRGSNIFLVGMMGSGKSTVGKLLANALTYAFFDSDVVIEQASGATVADIFRENGEDAFRDYESQVLQNLALETKCVVATGGGAVIRPGNWGYMRQGIIVWLDVPLPILAKRCVDVDGTRSRPLLVADTDGAKAESTEESVSQAAVRLGEILEKRRGQYTSADCTVSLSAIASEVGKEGEEDEISAFTIAYKVLEEIANAVEEKRQDQVKHQEELWKEHDSMNRPSDA